MLSVSEYVTTNILKLSLFQENNISNSILHRVKHCCWRRGCKHSRKNFEFVKIRAKSPKSGQNVRKFGKIFVQTFAKFLYVRLFCKNGTRNESEDVFLEVIFFRIFFGQVCRKLGKNSSHLQKVASSYTYGVNQCRISTTLPPPKSLQGPPNGDL